MTAPKTNSGAFRGLRSARLTRTKLTHTQFCADRQWEFPSAVTLIPFHVIFLHPKMRIPELTPLVFIGRNLVDNDTDELYFQDAASYLAVTASAMGHDGDFHTVDGKYSIEIMSPALNGKLSSCASTHKDEPKIRRARQPVRDRRLLISSREPPRLIHQTVILSRQQV
jgi:hypothetical protein